MLENTQILKEKGEAKFAVIDFDEYIYIKKMLSDPVKLQDHLDYLHIKQVKQKARRTMSLEDVKIELGL
ncbi:MAG: hypothetical protein ACRESZ_14345 [Methylococcales bacterium]